MTFNEAWRTPALKQTRRWILATFPLIVVLEGQATAAVGHWSLLFFETLVLLPLLAAPFAFIFLPMIAFRGSLRAAALAWWVVTIIFVPLAIGGLLVGKKVRHWGFERLAVRSVPLVSAISSYHARYGHPPVSLEALVPEFLPAVPKTGMMAYPAYQYYAGQDAGRFDQNPWVLIISTPAGGINFDQFMYFPLQNYPPLGYGGSLERIRDWAYVHE
jgi:hypothetical protein